MPVKYGWSHMGDSFEFSHAFRFRSEWNELLLTGEANFFLAKPYLSSSCMRTIISRENFRISRRKNTRGIRPLCIGCIQIALFVL